MFNQILMALKFGAASEFALVKGIELARAHDAELHIFHALDFTLNELKTIRGGLKWSKMHNSNTPPK
jgi:hypothetical protein